jgi:type I restriction enzyme S subunit
MFPNDWQRSMLGECVELLTGYAFSSQEYAIKNSSAVRLLRGDNVMQGALRWDDAKYWTNPYDKLLERYEMQVGDIVIAMDRPITNAGLKCSSVQAHDLPCLLVQRVARMRAKPNFDQDYLAQILQTHSFIQHLKGQKTETAVPHISPNDLRNFAIAFPTKVEQCRIAKILVTWDQAIFTAEQVLLNSRKQKQALTHSLLGDRLRRSVGKKALHREHASVIFKPRSTRNNDGLELLSVMQDVGVVPRSSLGRKVVMPEGSTSGYKLVEPGDFVISLRSFEGGLEYSKFKGLVSPAYTVLASKKPIVDDFYRHYFKSTEFIGRLAVAVIGIRDGKQISYEDFAFLRLPYPTISEQKEIAQLLNSAEEIIQKKKIELLLLRQEKAALMALLLTGKRRVRSLESAVEVVA